jgi:hypothetical protein
MTESLTYEYDGQYPSSPTILPDKDPFVYGFLREGREASFERDQWQAVTGKIRVYCTSGGMAAAMAARTWFNEEYEVGGVAVSDAWYAKSFKARPIEFTGRLWDVDVNMVPWDTEYADPNSAFYQGWSAGMNVMESETDAANNPITVSYTYPEDDEQWAGLTKYQGGSVAITHPTIKYRRTKHVKTWYPSKYGFLMGCVNSASWNGWAPGFVRCTSVQPVERPIMAASGRTPPTWAILFEFEGSSYYPWTTTVAYKDPRTGKTPADAYTQPTAILQVLTNKIFDFNTLFDTSEIPSWAEIIATEGF